MRTFNAWALWTFGVGFGAWSKAFLQEHPMLTLALMVGGALAWLFTTERGNRWLRPPMRLLNQHREPLVTIGLSEPVNQASMKDQAKGAELLHIEAALPVDRETPRQRLRVRAHVGGRTHGLRWKSGDGPQDVMTLFPGQPAAVLVVVRARDSERKFCPWPAGDRHAQLDAGVPYLADDNVLVHRAGHTVLGEGPIRVEVYDEEGGKESADFALLIGADGGARLTRANV